ncbi:MAG: prepilin peptidase [Chloroflexi bacterium]|nr:prepilin peptidase [Chloroflexota bacterium]MCL5949508.1 prepilin peptidase [Candidatus Bathyarchaeota archaeon]
MQVIFAAAQITLSIGILLYASWSDYKTREVSNRVWAVYAPIALSISLVQLLLFEPSQLPFYGLSFGVTAGLALLLFYAGGFGGADSKALMCIALSLPFAPLALFTPLLAGAISPTSQVIFPITIFGNAVLFAAASGIYMILRNVIWHKKTKTKMFPGALASESVGKKFLVLITGYKMAVSKVKAKWHIFPLEDVDDQFENVKRNLVIVPHDEGREKIVERLSKAAQEGKIDGYVWATPGLPMLIFVTLGLIVALVLGDFVWLLVRFVLGA